MDRAYSNSMLMVFSPAVTVNDNPLVAVLLYLDGMTA
jgi:hypothetical protein